MSAVRAAFGLLTRLPVGATRTDEAGASAFALVGAIVGLAAFVPLAFLGGREPTVAAVLAVAAMAILTGGLHLDGLADTADALVVPDRTRAEAARRDPAIGAAGAVAIGLVLATDVASLASLAGGSGPIVAGAAVIVAATVARAVAVVVARVARAWTPSDGFGTWFAARTSDVDVTMAALTAAFVATLASWLVWPIALAVAAAAGAGLGLALAGGVVAMRRQLDGDGLGAAVELTTAAVLVAAAVLAGV